MDQRAAATVASQTNGRKRKDYDCAARERPPVAADRIADPQAHSAARPVVVEITVPRPRQHRAAQRPHQWCVT